MHIGAGEADFYSWQKLNEFFLGLLSHSTMQARLNMVAGGDYFDASSSWSLVTDVWRLHGPDEPATDEQVDDRWQNDA